MILKKEILKAYTDGRLVLLLGAGASYDCFSRNGERVPQAESMARQMAEVKWSCKIGQSVKVYSNEKKGYQNDEETEIFRSV